MKEENKKVVKKTTKKSNKKVVKEPTKKVTKKVVKEPAKKVVRKKPVKPNLNETVNLESTKKEFVVADPNLVECKYCHTKFEKGYSICPNCHRRQEDHAIITFFIVFAGIFLFAIGCFHFIDKYVLKKGDNAEKYQSSCKLVDYESLVRKPKDYRNTDVQVIGKIIDISGYDDGFGNNMEITIDVNLFDNDVEQIINVEFTDKGYDQGFIIGDSITVYGKYIRINGDVPTINAKYIVLNK